MSPKEALWTLLPLLEEERVAIRLLDARRVEEIAARKLELSAIAVCPDLLEDPCAVAAMRVLARELRRNGVLLAHARACLQDALPIAHSVPAEGGRAVQSLAPRAGVLVSMRG